MRLAVKTALNHGMPCMAECGGFMYLHEEMEDMNGMKHEMCGVISGKVFRTPKLSRFGYVNLEQQEAVLNCENFGEIPAHEFHYFDSTACGQSFLAKKPESSRSWQCIHGGQRLMAGFPHLYYYGNPKVAGAFLKQCEVFRSER